MSDPNDIYSGLVAGPDEEPYYASRPSTALCGRIGRSLIPSIRRSLTALAVAVGLTLTGVGVANADVPAGCTLPDNIGQLMCKPEYTGPSAPPMSIPYKKLLYCGLSGAELLVSKGRPSNASIGIAAARCGLNFF